MQKVTVRLPATMKRALAQAASDSGRPQAELIREGIVFVVARRPPEPTAPLFSSGTGDLASRVDELLEGFGES